VHDALRRDLRAVKTEKQRDPAITPNAETTGVLLVFADKKSVLLQK